MVDKKNSAIVARRQARERLARERAEQVERNKLNEADLTDYLVLELKIATAYSNLDSAITSARERHQNAVGELKQRQASCLARMSRRGEPPAVIADRTGLTSREVKQLINQAQGAQSEQPSLSMPANHRNQLAQPASAKPAEAASSSAKAEVQKAAS